MKKYKTVLLVIAGILILLIVTKPSEEKCFSHYESYAKALTENEYSTRPSSIKDDPNNFDLYQQRIKEAENYSALNWKNNLSINDYFLFNTISYNREGKARRVGVGILNTFLKI
ncbi:MAG: hypothetical protein JWQ09_2990 [Segetibacter sp.]|nr:hypothetical protein [Segetibacter sp.]